MAEMAPRGREIGAIGAQVVGRRVVDETFGMRAAVLLDEAAECVNFRADRSAGDVVARVREGRLQRPGLARRIVDLVKALIDPVLGVTGDGVDFALALDHRVLAGRDRHARLFHPFARIGRLGRDAHHVALLLDGLGDFGDRLVVQAEEKRKFFCHDGPQLK